MYITILYGGVKKKRAHIVQYSPRRIRYYCEYTMCVDCDGGGRGIKSIFEYSRTNIIIYYAVSSRVVVNDIIIISVRIQGDCLYRPRESYLNARDLKTDCDIRCPPLYSDFNQFSTFEKNRPTTYAVRPALSLIL